MRHVAKEKGHQFEGEVTLDKSLKVTENIDAKAITAQGPVSAASFVTTSDISIKKDIHPLEDYANFIDNLKIKSFIKDNKLHWGVIAQDIERTNPEFVGEVILKDDIVKTIQLEPFIFAALAELQDLRAWKQKIEKLLSLNLL